MSQVGYGPVSVQDTCGFRERSSEATVGARSSSSRRVFSITRTPKQADAAKIRTLVRMPRAIFAMLLSETRFVTLRCLAD
jgi:hypothetical protein